MKQCATCRTTYTDETLRYCLADGGTLVEVGTDPETAIRRGVRVDIPPASNPNVTDHRPATQQRSNHTGKIVAAVLVLGFFGLIAVGAAGIYFHMNSGGSIIASSSPSPVPASPVQPTPDLEKQRLEQELANLQKQLAENTNGKLTPTPSKTPPGFESDDLPTARVNSPGDGFLALRSEPDSEHGERLAQIPHGTVITLESCEREKVKIGTRTGRWCLVTYRDHTGWVFDAWLDY